jgi:hypothetical protein
MESGPTPRRGSVSLWIRLLKSDDLAETRDVVAPVVPSVGPDDGADGPLLLVGGPGPGGRTARLSWVVQESLDGTTWAADPAARRTAGA